MPVIENGGYLLKGENSVWEKKSLKMYFLIQNLN